jgi:hypothetical protein
MTPQVFQRTRLSWPARLLVLVVTGLVALFGWTAVDDPMRRWFAVLLVPLLAVALVVDWWRSRDERWVLAGGELRRESLGGSEVMELSQLAKVEYLRSGGRIRVPPRQLWLTAGGATFCLGDAGSWKDGDWVRLVTALTPWMVRASEIDPASRHLLRAVSGCVLDGVPDGRPVAAQPPVRRHVDCPRPDLCDPHHPIEEAPGG